MSKNGSRKRPQIGCETTFGGVILHMRFQAPCWAHFAPQKPQLHVIWASCWAPKAPFWGRWGHMFPPKGSNSRPPGSSVCYFRSFPFGKICYASLRPHTKTHTLQTSLINPSLTKAPISQRGGGIAKRCTIIKSCQNQSFAEVSLFGAFDDFTVPPNPNIVQ